MSQQAIITINADGLAIGWLADDTIESVQEFTDPSQLDEPLRRRLDNARQTILVPTEDCRISRLQLPLRNDKHIETAIPFALEDQLVGELEDEHIAFAPRGGGTVDSVVVSHARMRAWLELLDRYALSPDVMVPAALAFPYENGVTSVVVERGMAHVRQGEFDAFAVEADELPAWLSFAKVGTDTSEDDDSGEKAAVLDLVGDDADLMGDLAMRLESAGWSIRGTREGMPEWQPADFNLLQRSYNIDQEGSGGTRVWRWLIACVLLLGVLEIGYLAWENSRLQAQSNDMAEKIKAVYLAANPQASRVVNPRAQMRHLIESRGSNDDKGFLALLGGFAASFVQADGGEISRLSFGQGRLDMAVKVNDVSAVEKLKTGLSAGNIGLTVLSLNSVEQGIEAHIRLEETGQ